MGLEEALVDRVEPPVLVLLPLEQARLVLELLVLFFLTFLFLEAYFFLLAGARLVVILKLALVITILLYPTTMPLTFYLS